MAGYIGSKAVVVSSGAERKKVFAITTSTTSLTGLVYTPGQVHVFHNGIRLVDGTDYTATDGTTITLTNAAANGDEVVVVIYAAFQTSDTVSASAGGTFSNAVTVDADGATVLTVDRATSDGTIIDVQKNGISVGSIGVVANDRLYIATDDSANSGLAFDGDNSRIYACTSSGATSDNTTDLGSGTQRFKDLYLSGGVYLGGTGAANYLDDYEEGTFSANLGRSGFTTTFSSISGERYIKIGRMVFVDMLIILTASGYNADYSRIDGLPFAVSGDGCIASYSSGQIALNANGGKGIFGSGSTSLYLYDANNNTQDTGWRVSGWYYTAA